MLQLTTKDHPFLLLSSSWQCSIRFSASFKVIISIWRLLSQLSRIKNPIWKKEDVTTTNFLCSIFGRKIISVSWQVLLWEVFNHVRGWPELFASPITEMGQASHLLESTVWAFQNTVIFFCLFPWKAVKCSWEARMGRNFDDYPGFQSKTTPAQRYATQYISEMPLGFQIMVGKQ